MIDTYRIYATDEFDADFYLNREFYDLIYLTPNNVNTDLYKVHQDLLDLFFRYSEEYVKLLLVSDHCNGYSKIITEIKSFDRCP